MLDSLDFNQVAAFGLVLGASLIGVLGTGVMLFVTREAKPGQDVNKLVRQASYDQLRSILPHKN